MTKLLGLNDANLHAVEDHFQTMISVRGDTITFRGDPQEIEQLDKIFKEFIYILHKNGELSINDVETVIDLVNVNGDGALPRPVPSESADDDAEPSVLYTRNGIIRAKTAGQREYIRTIKKNDIVFAIGPAGTGKTYLAVAMAVAALKNRNPISLVHRPGTPAQLHRCGR